MLKLSCVLIAVSDCSLLTFLLSLFAVLLLSTPFLASFSLLGPADYNYDETLSTLRYANRAKNIKNKPKINEDPKDAMLREYQDEIRLLKQQLLATQRGVMIDENGKEVPVHNAKREIIEKIVEKEVIKEIKVGLSEEEIKEIRYKAEQEKEFLMKQAQSDM
jgi:hypothetical protein